MGWTNQFAKHFLKSVSEGITDQQERQRKKEDLEDERDWQLKTEDRADERLRAAEDRNFGREKEMAGIRQGYAEKNAETAQGYAMDRIEEQHLNALEQSQKQFDRQAELTKQEMEVAVTNAVTASRTLLKSYGYDAEEIADMMPAIEAGIRGGDANFATKFKPDVQKPTRVTGIISKLNDKGQWVPIPEYSDQASWDSNVAAQIMRDNPGAEVVPLTGPTQSQQLAGAGKGTSGGDNQIAQVRSNLMGLINGPNKARANAAQQALDALNQGDMSLAKRLLDRVK